MTSRTAAVAFRFLFAALSLFAVIFQLVTVHVPLGYSVLNFFSYFTNLSNIVISVVFIVSAIALLRAQEPAPWDTVIRGGAVVYIAFVGLVFNTLLRDVDLGDLIPWVNAIVHFLIPVVAVVDWLVWPPRRYLRFRVVWIWMIFPAAYTVYSLVRGAAIGFYPYPFFNPAASGGYGGVAAYCAAMLVGFFILATLVWWSGNLRGRRLQAELGTGRA